MLSRGACALLLGSLFMISTTNAIVKKNEFQYPEGYHFTYNVRDFVADFARLNFNLFTKETALIASATIPVYGAMRVADERVHNSIYDSYHHKNLFDIGSCSKPLVEDMGLAIPIVGLTVGLWASGDANNRVTASLLLSGILSIGIVKGFVKNGTADCDFGCRPYCEYFKKQRKGNGFPSGHAATATYMTLLFALRKGIRWAFPVGVYSGIIIGLMVGCNYHYPSQIVAGIGLGAAYSLAANKVATSRLKENWELDLKLDHGGRPKVEIAYSF